MLSQMLGPDYLEGDLTRRFIMGLCRVITGGIRLFNLL